LGKDFQDYRGTPEKDSDDSGDSGMAEGGDLCHISDSRYFGIIYFVRR